MSHDVSGWCSLSSAHTRRNLLWDGLYYSQNVRALKYLYRVLISLPLQNCHMWQHFIPVSSASGIFSSSSWIYFWSRRGLFWLSWRCGVWRQCQGYWQTPGDTVWPLTPGTRPDIRLGKQCDQRERETSANTQQQLFSPRLTKTGNERTSEMFLFNLFLGVFSLWCSV